jgi:hypothetical protein
MRFLPLMIGAVLLVGPARATVISVSQNSALGPWGWGGGNATFGQTITAPLDSQLLDFTFQLGQQFSGSGAIAFQAHVFAWDAVNSRATGSSLYSSATIMFTAPASGFTAVTFSPNITLIPNAPYVLFFSTAGVPAEATSTIFYGINNSNPYSGGQVFVSGAVHTSSWTTVSWGGNSAADLAMTVNFGDAPVSGVPEPSTYGLCGAALAALGLLRGKRVASVDEAAGLVQK